MGASANEAELLPCVISSQPSKRPSADRNAHAEGHQARALASSSFVVLSEVLALCSQAGLATTSFYPVRYGGRCASPAHGAFSPVGPRVLPAWDASPHRVARVLAVSLRSSKGNLIYGSVRPSGIF